MADPSSATPVSGDGTPVVAKVDAAVLELPALLFGRYRVQGKLGQGGMGVVLLAIDEELGQQVAVKLIPDMVVRDTEAIADLKREVLRGMALLHPNIVRTHHFERDATLAAIIMEYVEGQTLADLKAQQADGCFAPADILPWLEQLCPVLDYAHLEAKIAHRDLKPRNLMLTPTGRLKVADFGIASQLSDSLTRITANGKFSGTPPYMSPQQAMGERPSHLDDIYALGATIYELLTSKPPFFRGHILSQVMHATAPAMTARLREFELTTRPALPLAWERVVAACLSKEPAERPQSAGELMARLKEEHPLPASRAVPAAPPVPDERAGYSYRPRMQPAPGVKPGTPVFEAPRALLPREPSGRSAKPWWWLAAGLVVLGLSATGWNARRSKTQEGAAAPTVEATTPIPASLPKPLPVTPEPLAQTTPVPASPSTPVPTPTVAGLVAKTDPPDTLVTLDERPAQRAPVRYGDLTPGRHRLFLTAKGYTTQTFDFLVTPGQTLDLGTIRLDRDIPAADSVKDNRFAGIWSGTRRTRMTMRFAFPVAGGLVRTQLATMTQPVSIEVSPDLASIRWHQDAITMQWEQAVYQNAPGNLDVDKDKPYTQTLQPPDKILGPFKPNITDKTLSFEVNDPSDSEHGGHLFVDLTPAPDGQTAECHYHHSIRFFASGAENSVEDEGFFTISRSTPGQKTIATPTAVITPSPATPAPVAAITPAQLSAFCEKLQRDEQSQDLNRILANYDTKVDFDNLGRVGQAAIRTDKAKYFQRWPQTTYQIKADPELLETHNDRWKVRFLIDFTATNPAGERVTGVAEQTLDLVLRNGALKVITEKGRVITRDKTQLPAGSGPLPAVPPAAVAGRRFDGHGAVYKIPDLKNLVGKSLKNSWLYGDFDYQSYQGNVAVFVTANIIGAVGKGSTVVTMESPTPVFVRQETVNNRQQYFNQFGIWPEVIVRIVPNDPIELLSVTREASGRLVVRTRSPKPIQL